MTTLRIGIDSTRVRSGVREAVAAERQLRASAIGTTTAITRQQASVDALGFSVRRVAKSFGLFIGALAGIRGTRDAFDTIVAYERSLVGLGKTAGISGAALDSLGRDFRNLSLQIPQSVTSLLDIGAAAAQLGIRGSRNLTEFTRVIAELSAAAPSLRESADEAALAIARIIKLTNEGPDSADAFTTVLVRLGNELEAQESGILNVARRVAQGTALFGLASSEVLTLAGAMEALAVDSEVAGSALQATLLRIQEAVRESGGTVAEELENLLGRDIDIIGQQLSEDAFGLLLDFLDALPSDAAGAEAALSRLELADRRVVRVLGVLSSRFGTVEESMELVSDELRTQESRSREAATAYDTIGGAARLLGNTLSVGLIDKLDGTKGTLADTILFARDVVGELLSIDEVERQAGQGAQALSTGIKVAASSFTVLLGVAKFDELIENIRTTTVVTGILSATTGEYITITRRATFASAAFSAALGAIQAHPFAATAIALGTLASAATLLDGTAKTLRELRPVLDDLEKRYVSLQSAASSFFRSGVRIERAEEIGDLDEKLRALQERAAAVERAILDVSTAIKLVGQGPGGALVGIESLATVVPFARADIFEAAANIEDQLIQSYVEGARKARNSTEAIKALQDFYNGIRNDARFGFVGAEGFAASLLPEDAGRLTETQFLRNFESDLNALLSLTDIEVGAEELEPFFQRLVDAYDVVSLAGDEWRSRLEEQAKAVREQINQTKNEIDTARETAPPIDPTRDQDRAAIQEVTRLLQERLDIQAALSGSFDDLEQSIRAQADAYVADITRAGELNELHKDDVDLIVRLARANEELNVSLAAREKQERQLADAIALENFLREQHLRIADQVRDSNLLVFATGENVIRQFGSAIGSAVAGFEDLATAARRALQSIIASFADAIAQALIFKYVVGPVLGNAFGLDTEQLRRELNVPSLGAFGLQHGGAYGSGPLTEAQVTRRPTPIALPNGQIAVTSEFNQPELLLRGPRAVAVIPLGVQEIGRDQIKRALAPDRQGGGLNVEQLRGALPPTPIAGQALDSQQLQSILNARPGTGQGLGLDVQRLRMAVSQVPGGSQPIETEQIQRSLGVPELRVLGLQNGGVFGSGFLSQAQITDRPTPLQLPDGRLAVTSEFGQRELVLRGANAAAVVPLGGQGRQAAGVAGGGGNVSQSNHYEFHQNNYFPKGTSNDEGLRRSLRGFRRDFRTFITQG